MTKDCLLLISSTLPRAGYSRLVGILEPEYSLRISSTYRDVILEVKGHVHSQRLNHKLKLPSTLNS